MSEITIGQYIIHRIKEAGIDTVFGVPGDFNMPLLDLIEDDENLLWGNNANELNASYAADGYARIKGAGCVVTTFGVGELSACSAIAGSYAEMIPVIHIVGTPSTDDQAHGRMIHHSIGNGDFQVYLDIFSKICVAAVRISKENAVEQIDRVFRESLYKRRPGYINIPIDLINAPLKVELKPLDFPSPASPAKIQNAVLEMALDAIEKAERPIILVDGCVHRHGLQKEAIEFVKRSGFPTYVSPMAKGIIPEDLDNYRGCYIGDATLEGIKIEVESADLIFELGAIKADSNTGRFSNNYDQDKTIALHSHSTTVFHGKYDNVRMAEFLPLLTKSLPDKARVFDLGPRHMSDPIAEGTEITHNYLWNKVPDYLADDSIIVTEVGCAEYASLNMRAPKNATFVSQMFWGAIGYTVGASVGVAMAARDRQVYLFCGDGSFQLTCQEVSVMLHQGLTPVIFILNNDGYLIEKLIHGPERAYNNFQMWQYSKTLDYFGCRLDRNLKDVSPAPVGVETKVSTRREFEEVMEQVAAQPKKIHFIEVVMPQFDAPDTLQNFTSKFKN